MNIDYSKIKILYYTWDEIVNKRALDGFRRMGINVEIFKEKRNSYDYDDIFEKSLINKLKTVNYDFVFTFNYFPIISRCCKKVNVKYVSWVYDSPHTSLESNTLDNACNRVFIFDKVLCERYIDKGNTHIYHMPLASDAVGVANALTNENDGTNYEISFVGNINFNKDYLSEAYLSAKNKDIENEKLQYLMGYLEAYINSTIQFAGEDMACYIPNEIIGELSKLLDIKLGEEYKKDDAFHIRNIIREKLTINERYTTLALLGKNHKVDWFSEKQVAIPGVISHGAVDYNVGMNKVFAQSKINLNITLRSIISGIPLRIFDILAAGGFCLTNYQKEIEDYFEIGKEIEVYYNLSDLQNKVEFYLQNEDIREKIAENGQKRIENHYSYEKVFGRIIETVLCQ